MRRVWKWLVRRLAWAAVPLRSKRGAILLPTFGELRGSIGGLTFSRNKGGMYAKQRATPTNPNSARQQTTRNQLATCASHWKQTLAQSNRDQWIAYAQGNSVVNALGQTIFLTGLDWFCLVNTRRLDAGLAILDFPGVMPVPQGMVTFAFTFSDGLTVDIAWTDALPSDHFVVAWWSGPIGSGVDPNFRQMKLLGYSPADQATPWSATLPSTISAGTTVKIYAGIMSEKGRVSVLLSDKELRV